MPDPIDSQPLTEPSGSLTPPIPVATPGGDGGSPSLEKILKPDILKTSDDLKPPVPYPPHAKLTPERIETFLEGLRKTGSPFRAAQLASPTAIGKRCGYDSFADLKRRDPVFATRWQEALDGFVGELEDVVATRALRGDDRPIYSRGQLMGTVKEYDTHLQLRILARHRPEWRETTKQELSGTLQNVNVSANITLDLKPSDLDYLSEAEQKFLVDILSKIHAAREAENNGSSPVPPRG